MSSDCNSSSRTGTKPVSTHGCRKASVETNMWNGLILKWQALFKLVHVCAMIPNDVCHYVKIVFSSNKLVFYVQVKTSSKQIWSYQKCIQKTNTPLVGSLYIALPKCCIKSLKQSIIKHDTYQCHHQKHQARLSQCVGRNLSMCNTYHHIEHQFLRSLLKNDMTFTSKLNTECLYKELSSLAGLAGVWNSDLPYMEWASTNLSTNYLLTI